MSDCRQPLNTSPANPAIEDPDASGGSPLHQESPRDRSQYNCPTSIEARAHVAIETIEDILNHHGIDLGPRRGGDRIPHRHTG